MGIFTATFSAVAVTAAQDVFEIVAPAAPSRVAIREIRLGQYTDFGDAAAEILSITIISGFTTSGSVGGTAPTPANVKRWSGAATAGSVVEINNTTLAQNGTGVVLVADAFNVQAGWWYYPPEDERIILDGGQRLVVRITAPADSVTMNGTLVFEEGPFI
jgi:hypothetical protein